MIGFGRDPELQRRREDFFKLDDGHPLCPLIQSCLKDQPRERPDIETALTQLLAVVDGAEVI